MNQLLLFLLIVLLAIYMTNIHIIETRKIQPFEFTCDDQREGKSLVLSDGDHRKTMPVLRNLDITEKVCQFYVTSGRVKKFA